MKLAPKTHQTFERFFQEYFADENLRLPASRIYAKSGAGLLTAVLRIEGITIGRHIFIKPGLTEYISASAFRINKNLLAHELTHVLQYQKLGLFGFLSDYVGEYFRGLRRRKKLNNRARLEAYWDISHEVEARQAAAKFIEWSFEK